MICYHLRSYVLLILGLPASMLELARLIVDSKWIPPRPVIFLFNGAEELFLLVFFYFFHEQSMLHVCVYVCGHAYILLDI